MMHFLRAHGVDPGPVQRPLLAGALTGLMATVPALIVFWIFGSLPVVADRVTRLSIGPTILLLILAFTLAGWLYGLVFRRAANDRHGGWLFGAAFGFALWMAAPIVVLPLMSGSVMAAGPAATGFVACFLVWGIVTGGLFPFIHRPLCGRIQTPFRETGILGPGAAAIRN